MDEGKVAALTAQYDAPLPTRTGKFGKREEREQKDAVTRRRKIAAALCIEAMEPNLGKALDIGRRVIKTSTHPAVVEFREARKTRANQTTKQYCRDIRKARAAARESHS